MTGKLDPSTRHALLQEARHRAAIREDLTYWAEWAIRDFAEPSWPSISLARHHRYLLGKLEQVARGEIKRLMVSMPPGSSKSTFASIIFPAWLMSVNPKCHIIGASHTASFAEEQSRKVQKLLREHALELGCEPINEAKDLWHCSNGSTYLAAGCRGPITGHRADFAIIDDPVKSREEVYSDVIREKTWKWYTTDLHTRLKPKTGSVVLIMTRWHTDDLAGRLQESERDGWEVIDLPSIWESDEPDALGRTRGELLWPEWQDKTFLDQARLTMGELDWAALHQQSPRTADGTLFKVAQIGVQDVAPSSPKKVVRRWDLASTSKLGSRDPDYTVGLKMQRNRDDSYTILDVVRFRGGPEEVRRAILNTAEQDGPGVEISLARDPGQAGVWQVNDLTKALAGYNVVATPESGQKETRAFGLAAQVNAGNVWMLRAPWNSDVREEMAMFPSGRHDDIIDAASGGFNTLIDLPRQHRRPTWGHGSHMTR